MKAYNKFILIKEEEVKEKTKTGIYVPEKTNKSHKTGKVIDTGSGVDDNLKKELEGNSDGIVIYTSPTIIKIDGEEYHYVYYENILGSK